MKEIPFNQDWMFTSGVSLGFGMAQNRNEPVPVTLPHDAAIHEVRSADADSGGGMAGAKGFFPNNTYLYTKKFEVPLEWQGKRIWLLFEGAYANAQVWVNGCFGGQCLNGYREFYISCDHLLHYGEENEVQVTMYTDKDSRWYGGGGLYREVRLLLAEPLHLALGGVRLRTASANEQVAAVEAELVIENDSLCNRTVRVEVEFRDGEGNPAAYDTQNLLVTGRGRERIFPRLYIKNPRLWSLEEPNVYRVAVRIYEQGLVDEYVMDTFGIRILELDNVRGLTINGKSVKLYGGCIHHDNGVIGAASIWQAEERRIRKLKEAGYNAVRSSHHPISRGMLSACDRYGVAVMDELGDMWNQPKSPRDYGIHFADHWQEDIEAMVEKDFNHACVLMYSIGNEICECPTRMGGVISRQLGSRFRQLDPTRFITAGVNPLMGNFGLVHQIMEGVKEPGSGDVNDLMAAVGDERNRLLQMHPAIVSSTAEAYEALDIAGYNYAAVRYLADTESFSNWVCVGTESYPKDLAANWKLVWENGNIIGDFSWAAWDYIGEAAIGQDRYRASEEQMGRNVYPWFLAYDGDFDITGEQTPQGAYREIVIGHRAKPYLAVQNPKTYEKEPLPVSWSWPGYATSWNWPGQEGRPIRVELYGKGDEAELFCNGVSLGRQEIPKESTDGQPAFCTVFDTVYTPGRLEGILYQDGQEWGRCSMETADEDVTVYVQAENDKIPYNDQSLAFVNLWIVDRKGRINRAAERKVRVTLEGPGTLQGLGSANPWSRENFWEDCCTTWMGHGLAVVRPTGKGAIKVGVSFADCPKMVQSVRINVI